MLVRFGFVFWVRLRVGLVRVSIRAGAGVMAWAGVMVRACVWVKDYG